MPAIVLGALLAGGAAAAGAWIAGGAFAFSWAAFSSTLLLGAAAQAFARKPAQNSLQARGSLVTLRQPISYWQVVIGRTAAQGVLTFRYVTADRQQWHMVVTFACHEIEAFDEIHLNDELVTLDGSGNATGKYAGYLRIKTSLGAAAEGQPFPDLVSESGGVWSADHLQHGHAKLYIRLTANPNLFPAGVPNFWAVIRGAKLYDPRSAGAAYSSNPALAVAHILTNADYGFGAVFADEIDSADLEAAANLCDEAVALAAGGTEARYAANGSFIASETPKDVIVRLNAAMAGKLVYVGDSFHILAGGYTAPTVTLDENDLAGPVTLQAHLDDRDNANSVRGQFTDPASSWQPTDFPALQSATYIAEDNGEVQWQDLDFSAFVTSVTQAQRLAKITLLGIRQGSTLAAPFKMPAYGVMPGKTVAINFAKYGLSGKVYEVVECGLTVVDDKDGAQLQVPLALRETAAAIFDWSTSEEAAQDFAPNTTLPDVTAGLDPTGLSAASGTAQLLLNGDGTIVPRILLSWTEGGNPWILHYELQFTAAGGSDWKDAPRVTAPAAEGYLFPVKDGVAYDVRIRAVSQGAYVGNWVTLANHTVIGKTANPSDVSGFSAVQQGDTILFGCNGLDDADLDAIEIRYNDSGIVDWASASVVTNILRGHTANNGSLPPGTWEIFAKARDTSGNYSNTAAHLTLAVTAEGYVTIDAYQGAPGWSGTLTHMVKTWDGKLTPTSQDFASALGWEVFDEFVHNPYADCYYEAPEVDLAVDGAVRVYGDIVSALGPGEADYADPQLELDYKTGAGAYDGFEIWKVGSANMRYYKARLHVATSLGSPVITSFAVTSDGKARSENHNDVAIGAGGTTLSFDAAFHNPPTIQVTPEGATPLLPRWQNKTTSSVDIYLHNPATGLDAAGVADITATGV